MWDESSETWTLPTLNTRKGIRLRERQTSGGSGRRPETEFSREMKLVDSNPRWRSEDIVDLDLVMPVRKSPASRDDPNTIDAIAAILAISMNDEVEELPLNEIRKNRKNKYLKAVSLVALVCVPCFSTLQKYKLDKICLILIHRAPPSRSKGAERTKPSVVRQQQHSKMHRNLDHVLSFALYFTLLPEKIFSFASKGGRLFVSIG